MGPETGSLLEHADVQCGIELLQPDGAGKTGGAGADDGHLVFHDIAGSFAHQMHLNRERARKRRPAKNGPEKPARKAGDSRSQTRDARGEVAPAEIFGRISTWRTLA